MKISQSIIRIILLCIIFAIVLMSFLAAVINKKDKPKVPDVNTAVTDEEIAEEPQLPEITWKTLEEGRELSAQQYFVYSCENDEFISYAGDLQQTVYPASITKLFTAYTALQFLEPTDIIIAGDALEMVMPGSSVADIEEGDELTVAELIEAMMLPSGNDAAYILACEIGWRLEGEIHYSLAAERFVSEMNTLAQAKGIMNTNFVNPDGIHEDEHYSTYEDLVKIAKLALEEPAIMKYTKKASNSETQWHNTNALVDPASEYYCPIAVGLKTGQTPAAGSCLLSAFSYNDETIIIGVFGCEEPDDRFDDTLQLLNNVLK